MNDYSRMYDGLAPLFAMLVVICVVTVPLGIWKIIELITLLFK